MAESSSRVGEPPSGGAEVYRSCLGIVRWWLGLGNTPAQGSQVSDPIRSVPHGTEGTVSLKGEDAIPLVKEAL